MLESINIINMNGKQKDLILDLDVYEILQPIIGLNSPACPNLGYETSPEMTSTYFYNKGGVDEGTFPQGRFKAYGRSLLGFQGRPKPS